MPAPSSIIYSSAVKTNAVTKVLTDIDAGAGAGKLKLYSETDGLLATITLADPAGSVTSGQLTITPGQTGTIALSNDCTYGTFTDSDDNVVITAPASEGPSVVNGQIVLNSTALIATAEVEIISCVIG